MFWRLICAKSNKQIYCYHALCKSFLIDCPPKLPYITRMARKPLSTRIENDLQKEIKKLAIDLEKPLNDLLEEAIKDLLKKYKKNQK
jgi:hypothetical protein